MNHLAIEMFFKKVMCQLHFFFITGMSHLLQFVQLDICEGEVISKESIRETSDGVWNKWIGAAVALKDW